ncbi:LysR family transcriptional regulator [Oleiagrimonas soli]|uniref:DNA-binding transcriptional LysR family regulator n=1 Tax=Oleiagrimonas soli TaxID=1543381 RepID=A0A099CZ04_9GAMM|nr:LysR family transcriptional regulator [Oleiagrimonas soli]KGI78260.1 transcriptional regulator [Oleiagrimonas soli]MBB6183262.1 DNA-binding transcriptional LysR family regulator [Oleiagrimonas soli]
MDRLDAMSLFVRIVERRSFTMAANDMQIPRSTATKVIAALESRLGVRLLQRTTRVVRPTLDGEAFHQRCLRILEDVEDAEGAFRGAQAKGLVRVEVQGTLARHFLLPRLPEFFSRYPGIELSMSESDRWIDPVQEGVDCVLRYGHLRDSELVARQVTLLQRLTCASPGYLEQFGVPESIDDLDGHRMVSLRSLTSGQVTPLEFQVENSTRSLSLPSPLTVTGTESYLDAIRLGLGLAQVPYFHVEEDLRSGRLVQLLDAVPPPSVPVSLVFSRGRQLSPRVRAFLEWAVDVFKQRETSAD